MAIHILVATPAPATIILDGALYTAVRLLDLGKPSESVDAAIARASAAWTGRPKPAAALWPGGRLTRWEPGLLHVADADVAQFLELGQVAADGPPVLLRPDGTPWTHADAIPAGILDVEGNFRLWQRLRIVEVVSTVVNEITSPNAGSAGPLVRQFATLQVRLDDGTTDTLDAYWYVPADHLAAAATTLPGLPLSDAHEWLSEPLRRRVEADARVLCAGGPGLHLRCGNARLRLEPALGGEVLVLEGIAGHALAAGAAVAAAGARAAMLGADLAAAGGAIRFEILGIAASVELAASDDGGLRVRCVVGGKEEVVAIGAAGVRAAMADVSGYLEWCGDLSMAADGGVLVKAAGFGRWQSRETRANGERTRLALAPAPARDRRSSGGSPIP